MHFAIVRVIQGEIFILKLKNMMIYFFFLLQGRIFPLMEEYLVLKQHGEKKKLLWKQYFVVLQT